MTPQETEYAENAASDPLDMSQYQLNRLPRRERSVTERWLARIGGPLALVTFLALAFGVNLPFLSEIDPQTLGSQARTVHDSIGPELFSARTAAMLAIFAAGIILWITEAIPNYLTSLIVIISLVLTGVLKEVDAYHQLGHKVMWLNILSFILASALVQTGVAKRFALWFIGRFGTKASTVFLSFIVINVVLSAFISATTAKAAILLPIFMVVAAVYGATGGKNKNNLGRNLVLQNLFQINMGAGAFVTGSGANLLAASMIVGATGTEIFFLDWMQVAFPLSMLIMIIGVIVGTRFIFPLPPDQRKPQIAGGMDRLRDELKAMGPMSLAEIKAVVIFVGVLAMWSTDRLHGISPTAIAFVGAIIALLPRIGIIEWNQVDIPWHLLLFSAGAYTLGAGFKETDLPRIMVDAVFRLLGLGSDTPFIVLFLILTGTMLFSALVFQSKTMRTLVFVPISIGVAQNFGYPVMSLAFPVALMIEHVYVLPFNSKPAALLYVTDQYSMSESFRFGIVMMFIAWILLIVGAMTFLRWMGITPDGLGLF